MRTCWLLLRIRGEDVGDIRSRGDTLPLTATPLLLPAYELGADMFAFGLPRSAEASAESYSGSKHVWSWVSQVSC